MKKEEIDIAEEYFQRKEIAEVAQDILSVYPKTFESIIPLTDTGLSPTTFFQWKKKGLIPELTSDNAVKRKWVRLNLMEYLWVKFVQALNDLGIGFDEIILIKNKLLENPLRDFMAEPNAFDQVASIDPQLKGIKDQMLQFKNAYDLIPASHRIFVSQFSGYITAIYLQQKYVTILVNCIPSIIKGERTTTKGRVKETYKIKSNLVINSEGFIENDFVKMALQEFKAMPHISIPLKSFVDDFFKTERNIKHAADFGIINEEEMKLLVCVRKNDYKQIIIKKDKEEKLVIDVIKEQNLREEKLMELRKILGLKDYQKITIIHRNDKDAYIENTIRQK